MPNDTTSSRSSSSKSNSTTGCFVVGPVLQHAASQSDEVVRAGELGAPFPVRARPAVRLRGHPPRRQVDLGAVVVGVDQERVLRVGAPGSVASNTGGSGDTTTAARRAAG